MKPTVSFEPHQLCFKTQHNTRPSRHADRSVDRGLRGDPGERSTRATFNKLGRLGGCGAPVQLPDPVPVKYVGRTETEFR